jgi:putative Holliday junction resolvase
MYLGIDYGSKRIGLALAEATGPSLPWKIIDYPGDSALIEEIKKIVASEHIDRIVVGWPLSLQGKITERTTATDTFIKALQAGVDVEIIMEDERMTSGGADVRQDGKPIDDVSAARILQTFIDRHHEMGS